MIEEAPLTYESTEFIATLNKRMIYFWFWITLFISAIAGLYFFTEHNGILEQKSNFVFFFFVFSGLVSVFFYYASKNNRPEFVINNMGIWGRSSGYMPWDQMRSFGIVRLVYKKGGGMNFLVLQDHKQQEININIQELNKTEDEIIKAILKYSEKHEIYYSAKIEKDV